MNKETYLKEYPKYKQMRKRVKQDKYRLQYHLMPPTGFLNDPNGLCYFNGMYHIYFQYTPFDTGWGTKLWGHYTTKDFITYQEEEPFLYPDHIADRDGAYSGSAFVENNQIHYFYTGNVKLLDKEYDYINEGRQQNTIHITSNDGFQIDTKEWILSNNDYPQDMSKHVRDPKIFKHDTYYYMVLGARTRDNKGCVLLYRSIDLQHFTYYNRITTPEPFGYMWECPDLFEINNKLYLMCCPQGVMQQGYKYANVYQCGYYEIDYDFTNNQYQLSEFKELDHGFDIYAPQSFEDHLGRRIVYAWMGIPDAKYTNPTIDYAWQHALTMPRQLVEKNGVLYQKPLKEMQALRQDKKQILISELNTLKQETICYEMHICFDNQQDFKIQIRDDIILQYQNHILSLSLKESGYGRDIRSTILEQIQEITIFSDTSSLEIFINDGQVVFTTRVYSKTLHQQLIFLSNNRGNITYYPLSGFQITKGYHYD